MGKGDVFPYAGNAAKDQIAGAASCMSLQCI
jgi:hypothetical protein